MTDYTGAPLHSKCNNRPSWDDYFLETVDVVARRASCDRGKSGCVIVRDNRILSTGYVGSPSGLADCYEQGHLIRKVTYEDGSVKEHCIRTIHAEQNAILYAARFGVNISGSTLYCTMVPCRVCAMHIVAVDIKRVVCKYNYHAGAESLILFHEADIEYKIINDCNNY